MQLQWTFLFQIEKTGCGDTKGCYSLPKKCTGSADCNYVFTYQVSAGKVVMEMSAKERYVAVAFNDQKLMVSLFRFTSKLRFNCKSSCFVNQIDSITNLC